MLEPVAVLGCGVLAGSADDGGEVGDVQKVQEALPGGGSWLLSGWSLTWRPGAGTGGAGVSGGGPVGVQYGEAPASGGVPRGGHQVPGIGVYQELRPELIHAEQRLPTGAELSPR